MVEASVCSVSENGLDEATTLQINTIIHFLLFLQVTWRKFDDTITSDDNIRYEIIKQGCGRSLIINEAIPEDIALYTVEGLGGSCTVNLVMNGGT